MVKKELLKRYSIGTVLAIYCHEFIKFNIFLKEKCLCDCGCNLLLWELEGQEKSHPETRIKYDEFLAYLEEIKQVLLNKGYKFDK